MKMTRKTGRPTDSRPVLPEGSKLEVLYRSADTYKNGAHYWVVRCSCGGPDSVFQVLGQYLKKGLVKHCGCEAKGPKMHPRFAEIKEWVGEGKSLQWIGERLDISRQAVHQALKKGLRAERLSRRK